MEKKYLPIVLMFLLTTISSLAMFDPEDEKALTVYPNPARELISIKLQSDLTTTPVVHILNLTGKVVLKFDESYLEKEEEQFQARLDISSLKSGIYFVKIIQGSQVFSEKLVVK